MSEEECFQNLAYICGVGPGEVRKMVEDYIQKVTSKFEPLSLYPKSRIYIKPVKIKTLKERLEDNKMKATSIQKIDNVNNITFSIEKHPIERKSLLTVIAETNDDIFAFEFEGSDLIQQCKAAGLFTGWEKDQKIRELENQNKKILDTNRKLQEKIFCKDHTINELEKELICWRKRKFTNEKTTDNVNHPSHYAGKYECIDVMQDVFGNEATDNFCLCNAFKYIWRARKKNGLEDVKKAVWYLNKYIEEAEKDGEDEVTRT